jgi:hypothetical protein
MRKFFCVCDLNGKGNESCESFVEILWLGENWKVIDREIVGERRRMAHVVTTVKYSNISTRLVKKVADSHREQRKKAARQCCFMLLYRPAEIGLKHLIFFFLSFSPTTRHANSLLFSPAESPFE